MIIEIEERISPGSLWEFRQSTGRDHHDFELVVPELKGIQPGELIMISTIRPGPFISTGDHMVVIEPFVQDDGTNIRVLIDIVINAQGGTKRVVFGSKNGLAYGNNVRRAKDWLIKRWDWLFDRLD